MSVTAGNFNIAIDSLVSPPNQLREACRIPVRCRYYMVHIHYYLWNDSGRGVFTSADPTALVWRIQNELNQGYPMSLSGAGWEMTFNRDYEYNGKEYHKSCLVDVGADWALNPVKVMEPRVTSTYDDSDEWCYILFGGFNAIGTYPNTKFGNNRNAFGQDLNFTVEFIPLGDEMNTEDSILRRVGGTVPGDLVVYPPEGSDDIEAD